MKLARSGSKRRSGFSLVEVLAAITIIGVITFLAIPNIVRVKQQSEDDLARARANALLIATSAYFRANGDVAVTEWSGKDNNARYVLVSEYLAFAPTSLTNYMPGGYSFGFTDSPLEDKPTLTGPGSIQLDY